MTNTINSIIIEIPLIHLLFASAPANSDARCHDFPLSAAARLKLAAAFGGVALSTYN
jgi:hypothetical protein